MGCTPTARQIPEPVNQHSFRGSTKRKPVKAMELQGLQMSHNVQLRLRVVGDQNANHVLIRVRHRIRASPRVSFSEGVPSGKAVVLQTILGLVLRLVDLILISVFLCLLHHPTKFGLRQLPFSSLMVIWLDSSWADTFKFVSQVLPPRLARGQHRSLLRVLRVEIFTLIRLLLALLFLSWVLLSQPLLFLLSEHCSLDG